MKGVKRIVLFFSIVSSTALVSCMSGIDPLPSEIKDLSFSLSIPVGNADITIPDTYSIGPPNYWLGLDFVPDWAKYEEVYYTDTVAVDLSKVFENSSNVTYLAFRINIWNEYKTKCKVDMYFADLSYNSLYTFNTFEVLEGQVVFKLNNVNVISPGYSWAIVAFDKTQIENLSTAEFLIFNAKINLKNADPYNFKNWEKLKLNCQIGARVDFILNDI